MTDHGDRGYGAGAPIRSGGGAGWGVWEPAFALPVVVSTFGAGDVFHGALLAGLVEGMEFEGALRFASGA